MKNYTNEVVAAIEAAKEVQELFHKKIDSLKLEAGDFGFNVFVPKEEQAYKIDGTRVYFDIDVVRRWTYVRIYADGNYSGCIEAAASKDYSTEEYKKELEDWIHERVKKAKEFKAKSKAS